MDGIVSECANRHLRNSSNLHYVQNEVIKRTYRFTYTDFRTMLVSVLGLVKVEEIEKVFNPTKFHLMKSSLGTLKQQRDREAHTYTTGVTHNIIAPSEIINRHFPNVYNGLKDVERCIRRIKM